MGTIDHAHFVALLAQHYPEILANVDDCSTGLLHLEMATVARATQAAIDAGDTETVRKHFSFIDEVFRGAAPDVENAVYVSYLENLFLFDVPKARELLTPRLKQALADLEAHWEKISAAVQKNPNPTT